VLQVASLTKRYGHLAALSEVSFSIRPGEVLGVIGPNGSGKTTLFECLGGVLPADAGSVLRDARPLTSAERTSTLFYLPDLISPWPSETVRWALAFTTGYFGGAFGRDRSAPSADDVIARLELEPLLDSTIGTLSKGQRKRALLAIGLLTPQPILMADEPFDGLDLRQTREVATTLRHYATAGRTMLLSIHQIGDAARVCDRFVLLSGGRTRGEGSIDELAALAASRGGDTRTADARGADVGPRARDVASTCGDLEEIFLALT
jgi:ABC-2 type transport system ATP-binding protein